MGMRNWHVSRFRSPNWANANPAEGRVTPKPTRVKCECLADSILLPAMYVTVMRSWIAIAATGKAGDRNVVDESIVELISSAFRANVCLGSEAEVYLEIV